MKVIYNDGTVAECPKEEELHVIRHTAAHIMAQAIKRLWPQADFAYGPATDKGFYYDVDLGDTKLTDEDLLAIEKEMKKITKENLPIKTYTLPREEAIKHMEDHHETYKVEHIGDLPEDAKISFYSQGEYVDMCVGPHLTYTKGLKAFKITGQSGADWKADTNNKMRTRIYGTAFATQQELDDHMKLLEEAERRDHRRIGKEMQLFMICEEGPGFPFFLPNGMALKNALIDYWRDIHYRENYVEVSTPLIMNRKLWETSGHWDHYRDDMFPLMEREGEEFVLRPMNCPHHMLVYKNELHSYKDLPIRIGELAHDFRFEASGAVCGIERVRTFCQNDAHLFVRPDQIEEEFGKVVNLILDVYKDFNITPTSFRLSLRDKNNK